ncbi:type II secretion system F family protein [Granulicoccus sp. GXG6511]|uniref:type II secretion system F family protein n=1 Tax=Granulicoccus sp. GXG6511 TaxID=3381351 RepID=UPI003D7DB608
MTTQLLTGLVLLSGMFVMGGLVAALYGGTRAHPRLADGLGVLDGVEIDPRRADLPVEATSRSERAGLWAYRRTPIPLTASQSRVLELQNKSIAEFYADKLVIGLLGLLVPGLLGGVFLPIVGLSPVVPVIAALAGGVVGWFVPDLLLRRGEDRAQVDAAEAMFTYFDLVTLERMANLSATQSLESAASTSDHPLFLSIRAALLRARLEQHPPFGELRALADRLRLPQLADIADVLQLDETGAAVTGTLRARVRELRDAHLTAARIAAHEVSERMTVFMAVPAMVFGLIFLAPPLLRLIGG